jgi:hypothetical protein
MFRDSDGVVCPDCKPEGAEPLGEWLKTHTKVLSQKDAVEMAWKGELKPFDLSHVNIDPIVRQIAKDYGVPPESIKLVGHALYFATDDRKVTMAHQQFSGNVAQLLFQMIEQQGFAQAVQAGVMKLMLAMRLPQPQGCDGECSGCGEGCEPTPASAPASAPAEKRPEFDSLYG